MQEGVSQLILSLGKYNIDMKKILLSIFTILSFGGYVLMQRQTTNNTQISQARVVSDASVNTPTPTPSVAIPPGPSPAATTTPSPKPMMKIMTQMNSKFKNGTFTSSSVDASYGNVQIRTIFKNDKISQIEFIDYPQDRNHSLELSSYAMPQLKSEAIQSQNANVDIVSGATLTSLAFRQALQETISQAAV